MTEQEAPFPTFDSEYSVCLANGHRPVLWDLPSGQRKYLCQRCGRTWPTHYARLMTMPGIEALT